MTAHGAYANADEGSGGLGLILLSVRVTDWVVAMRSVERHNASLRKKLGLSLGVFPRKDGITTALSMEL
jgi:hypothetical protein